MNYNKEYFENLITNYITIQKENASKFISILESDINTAQNIKFGILTTKDEIIKENEINIKRVQKQVNDYITNVNYYSEDFIYCFQLINIPEADSNSSCYGQNTIDSYFKTVITTIINCNIFIHKNIKDNFSRRVKGHKNNNGKRTNGKKYETINSISNHFDSLIEYFELTDNLYLVEILNEEKEYALNLNFSNKSDILQRCYICLFRATYELLIAQKYSNNEENFLTNVHGNEGLDNSIYEDTKTISLFLLTSFFEKLQKTPTITSLKDTDCRFNYLSKFHNK